MTEEKKRYLKTRQEIEELQYEELFQYVSRESIIQFVIEILDDNFNPERQEIECSD